MPASVVEQVEEVSTINAQLDKDLTFEYRYNIPIEDYDNTTKGAATVGVDMETPGVKMEVETLGVEIYIRTPKEKNPNKNE